MNSNGSWTHKWKICKKIKCKVTAARIGTNNIGFCSGIANNAPVKLKNSLIGKDWITMCIINLDNNNTGCIRETWHLKLSEANAIIHCLAQSIDCIFEDRYYSYRMKKLAKVDSL